MRKVSFGFVVASVFSIGYFVAIPHEEDLVTIFFIKVIFRRNRTCSWLLPWRCYGLVGCVGLSAKLL